MANTRNLKRLAHNFLTCCNWRKHYFENFAVVQESVWQKLFEDKEMISRNRCQMIFNEVISKSPATDPGNKLMHWDMQAF